jgi:hypothetical protein
VARTWLQIKVELVSGLGGEFEPPPGRAFAVGSSVTFERFADAINRAFGLVAVVGACAEGALADRA